MTVRLRQVNGFVRDLPKGQLVHGRSSRLIRLDNHLGSSSRMGLLPTCPQFTRNRPSSASPRLKNRKVIGMVDEDLPEELHRQQSVEVRCTGILLGAYQGDEGYLVNFN
jgi:hypothetical protein